MAKTKILEYSGSFILEELHDELLKAGVAVRTVVGPDNEDPPYSNIQIYVADAVRENAVTAVVDQHDATKVLVDQAEATLRRGAAKVSGEAKLRTFYTTEVGLTGDEIDAII